uniref:Uncharacterized protein n=1 Tax=Aplanochytrium stocchinoi TaxID=215587 RepID=A0A6S8BK51_9STRA|mmetsp:Transcript_12833/g.15943  ORF Transcript_12833/g.15943 Transcript_12833/m.15943 type:complete len:410 (-) Transcript_12833:1173-2402(-)
MLSSDFEFDDEYTRTTSLDDKVRVNLNLHPSLLSGEEGNGIRVKAEEETKTVESNMQEILHEELNKLRLEHRKVKKQLIHAQTELDSVKQENEGLHNEIDRSRRESTDLRQSFQNRETKLKSDTLKLQNENEELKEHLKILAENLTRSQEMKKLLEEKLRESEENLNFVKGLVREREYELSCSHTQKNDLLYNLNQNKIAMQTQWKETLQQVTKNQSKIDEENSILKQEISTLLEREKGMKNNTKQMLVKIENNVELKNEKLARAKQLLRREIANKEKVMLQLQLLREEKDRLTESTSVLREKVEKLKKELARMKNDKKMADMVLRKREDELAAKDEEIVSLVYDHVQEKTKISSDLRRQLEDEIFAVNTLKVNLREYKDELRKAKEQIVAHQQIFAALDVKLDSINSV